jgi:hypothetical protein
MKPAVWKPVRMALAVSTFWAGEPLRNLEKSMSCGARQVCVGVLMCVEVKLLWD